MSVQIVGILDFKKQKATKKCNECQNVRIELNKYKNAMIEIADILLKLPTNV